MYLKLKISSFNLRMIIFFITNVWAVVCFYFIKRKNFTENPIMTDVKRKTFCTKYNYQIY